MDTLKVPIRNKDLPEAPRVFDVTVNVQSKTILRYDMQHISGRLFIGGDEVQKQIDEAIEKHNK